MSTTKMNRASKIRWNPYTPEFRNNPYLMYHRLRELDPIHWHQVRRMWLLTRYSDIKQVLRDRRVRVLDKSEQLHSKEPYLSTDQTLGDLKQMSSRWLMFINPPDHSRLRNLLGKGFLPQVVEQLRPRIQEIVDSFLLKVTPLGKIDLINDLAASLPVYVIAFMLGVPEEDHDMLNKWSTIMSRILDPSVSLEEYLRMNSVVCDFRAYFLDLVEQRRQHPQNDLISAFIAVQEEKDSLSDTELWIACVLLFVTGEETTVNTIGNGMLALLNHPEQMQWLRQHPDMISQAVEELLRFDSPVQITARVVVEDFELGGVTMKPNEEIYLCLGAANRDPVQFSNPDELDLTRSVNPHLAFSDGIHYCLGAALARVQSQIAINTLLKIEDLSLTSEALVWRKNVVLRGLTSLPITFKPFSSFAT